MNILANGTSANNNNNNNNQAESIKEFKIDLQLTGQDNEKVVSMDLQKNLVEALKCKRKSSVVQH